MLEIDLQELGEAAGKTQEELAEALKKAKSEVSRLENGLDRRLSTLQRYVAALGGELEVVATFGSRRVRLARLIAKAKEENALLHARLGVKIRELKADHLKISKVNFKEDIYPFDFLILAALNRSLCLVSAFAALIETRNFIAAAPLIRLQLDNSLRLFAATLVDEPHEFAMQVLGGARIDRIKDKQGNRLTDKYLVTMLRVHEPWIESVYEEASGFIHLSEKHIFNALKMHDEGEDEILMKISDEDEFVSQSAYEEAVVVFAEVTKLILSLSEGWAVQKAHAVADSTKSRMP